MLPKSGGSESGVSVGSYSGNRRAWQRRRGRRFGRARVGDRGGPRVDWRARAGDVDPWGDHRRRGRVGAVERDVAAHLSERQDLRVSHRVREGEGIHEHDAGDDGVGHEVVLARVDGLAAILLLPEALEVVLSKVQAVREDARNALVNINANMTPPSTEERSVPSMSDGIEALARRRAERVPCGERRCPAA
eukprot:504301-Prymnesium_polylepis.1